MNSHFVYILASKRNGTLYIGYTNDLKRRIREHKKEKSSVSFTKRYGVKMLVYYEKYIDEKSAFKRERQMKKWNRKWKINLVEEKNPEWKDLFDEL